MTPYFVIFAILALIAFSDTLPVTKELRMGLYFAIGIILSFFAGFRFDLPDWEVYKMGFEEISKVGYNYNKFEGSEYFEPLYNLIVYFVTLITNQYVVMFLVVAVIAVTLNLAFYQKYSKYFIFATLLYFVHTFLMRETMQIRSGVAAGIVLWALPYVERKQFWQFLLMIVLAMGFHMASGAFLLVYLVYKWNWRPKIWWWIVGTSFLIGIFIPFGRLLIMLPGGGVFERILIYSWMIDQGAQSGGVLTNPTIIKQLFSVSICLIYWDTLSKQVPFFRLLVTPLLISVCWLMVWNDFAIVAGRMGTFFSVTEVLVIPMFMYLVTPSSRLVMGILIVIYAFATLALNLAVENVLPYQSIFFK